MFIRDITKDWTEPEWDESTDVLVIGGGGCGLTAAVSAYDTGADVTLLEKSDKPGGKTRLSSGQVCGADTRFQRHAGIDDSPNKLFTDLLDLRNDDPAVTERQTIRSIVEESAAAIEWLADEIGVTFELHTGPYDVPGNSVYRTHYPVDEEGEIPRTGGPIVDGLESAAEERNIDVYTNSPATQLVTQGKRVIGAVAKQTTSSDPRKQEQLAIHAAGTIVATDGFGANHELRLKEFPETNDLEYWGASGNTGESIKWGDGLGAARESPHFNAYPMFSEPEGVWIPLEVLREGALYVNSEGHRFIDASNDLYLPLSEQIRAQKKGIAFVIIDQEIRETLATARLTRNQFRNGFEQGIWNKGDSIRELGAELEVDPDALEQSLREANSTATEEGDDDYGRNFDRPLSKPFFGTKIKPRLTQARAGLRVNSSAQVLSTDSTPIPNMYAGGNAAAAISGGTSRAYLPGTNLMTALSQGRIAGTTAAKETVRND